MATKDICFVVFWQKLSHSAFRLKESCVYGYLRLWELMEPVAAIDGYIFLRL